MIYVTSLGNNPMVGATVACAVAVEKALKSKQISLNLCSDFTLSVTVELSETGLLNVFCSGKSNEFNQIAVKTQNSQTPPIGKSVSFL